MKILTISNVRVIKSRRHATLTVTTGLFWWKKTDSIEVFRDGTFWRFIDGGGFTPGDVVEDLYASHEARRGLLDETT